MKVLVFVSLVFLCGYCLISLDWQSHLMRGREGYGGNSIKLKALVNEDILLWTHDVSWAAQTGK